MSERFLTSTLNTKDPVLEDSLRPQFFDAFPGQNNIKEQLQIVVESSKRREQPISHILLSGPPGLGKTTLANIIANEKGCNIRTSSGPSIEKPGDLAGLLTSLEEGDILFIDEIHRLPITVEEYLYSAMEDFIIDIMIDQGAGARSIRLNVAPFTLIGATTRQGLISTPLLSRFPLQCRLDYYSPEELSQIILRSAKILQINIHKEGAMEIARRARGTARIANNLLKWTRDYALVKASDQMISQSISCNALKLIKIDQDGLDEMDKRILETLIFKFDNRPVGLKTIAAALSEEQETIEEVYEPYLLQEGFIMRTPQGRIATNKARQRFNLEPLHISLNSRVPPETSLETPNLF